MRLQAEEEKKKKNEQNGEQLSEIDVTYGSNVPGVAVDNTNATTGGVVGADGVTIVPTNLTITYGPSGGGESGGGDSGDSEPEEPKEGEPAEVIDSNTAQQRHLQSFAGMMRADGSPMVVTDENGNLMWNPEPEGEVIDSNTAQQRHLQSFAGMMRADGSPMVVTDENGNLMWNPEAEKEAVDSTGGGDPSGGDHGSGEPSYLEFDDYLEEYYKGAEQREQEKRETSYAANAQIKESAIKTADASRDRAIVDARSSAELRESSYGANAEALAGMGLSSSGYKDYYDSVSYAQMREETQYANAQFDAAQRAAIEQETLANKEADLRYETNMDANAKEYAAYMQNKNNEDSANRTNTFNTAYNMVRNGDSVDSAIAWLASQGITLNDSEKAALKQAGSDYSEEKAEIDAKSDADKFASIYNSVANGSIDLAGAQNLAAKYGITLSESDISMLQGAINRHQAGVEKTDNAYKMDVLGSFYNQIFNGMSVEEAMAAIEGYGITLSESDKTYLNGAATRHANGKAELDESEANAQAINFLSMAKSGEWSAEELAVLVEKAGLGVAYTTTETVTEINENGEEVTREVEKQVSWAEFISSVANATALAQVDEDRQNSIIKITELAVNGANAAALELIAGTLGINVAEIQGAIGFANNAAAEKTAVQQKTTAYQLIGFAESGKFSAEELANLAAMEGLDDVVAYKTEEGNVTYADIISGVANRVQQEQTDEELKALGYQYMEWAKNGVFTAEELANLAAMEGLDDVVAYTKDGEDVTWGDIISELAGNTAEVTMNGYRAQLNTWIKEGMSSSFIEDMAEMWGLSDEYAEEVKDLATSEGEAKEDAEKAEKANKLISLIAEASNGASAATIKALAEAMELEYDDYKAAMDIATGLEEKRQNSNYAELMSQLGDDIAAIDAMVNSGDITYQQGVSLKQNGKYNDISNDIQVNGIFAEIPMADISDNVMGPTLDQVGPTLDQFGPVAPGVSVAPVAPKDVRITLTDEQVDELVYQWNTVAQDKLSGLITSVQSGEYPSTEDMQRIIKALKNSYVNDSVREKFVNLIKELMEHHPIAFKKNYEDIDFSAFVNIDYTYGIPIIVPDDGG
ncbi:MAG: hypothetical protein E7667_03520 [Ruminococcaceae bacterium]|nr:hypothetical protein [Oscillospiraceae bacterium]